MAIKPRRWPSNGRRPLSLLRWRRPKSPRPPNNRTLRRVGPPPAPPAQPPPPPPPLAALPAPGDAPPPPPAQKNPARGRATDRAPADAGAVGLPKPGWSKAKPGITLEQPRICAVRQL